MRPAGSTPRALCVAACVAGVVAAAAWAGGCRKASGPTQVSLNGKRWFVDLAVTPQQRFAGLAGRTDLPDDVGMLFIYPDSSVLEFCMRGCVIPLDIAFLDEHRRVVHTATMAVEADRVGRVVYTSQRPARYALEVAAGGLAAAGVKVGDQASFSGEVPR